MDPEGFHLTRREIDASVTQQLLFSPFGLSLRRVLLLFLSEFPPAQALETPIYRDRHVTKAVPSEMCSSV